MVELQAYQDTHTQAENDALAGILTAPQMTTYSQKIQDRIIGAQAGTTTPQMTLFTGESASPVDPGLDVLRVPNLSGATNP